MRIGILSMQRVINYGSFLQAYALKKTLENLNHEVFFVDIRSTPNKKYKYSKIESLIMNLKRIDKYIIKRIQHKKYIKERYYKFITCWQPSIGITSPIREKDCDMIVIGSDEVFNCCQQSKWGLSLQLFGDMEVPSLTYAASCGNTTYRDVKKRGINTDIERVLKKLYAISVRDDNSREFVYELIKKVPQKHLDPVLIYDWTNEVKSKNEYKNYILIYAYDNRINDEKEIKEIKRFAKKYKKTLISFGVYQRWCHKNILCSPFELISYFDDADYVITDTFHGTVLSIKRNKQFATIIRDTNKNKIRDLLSQFALENREITNVKELDSIISRAIDYGRINKILEDEQKRAVMYFKSNLVKI